jgi:hypothetical protein
MRKPTGSDRGLPCRMVKRRTERRKGKPKSREKHINIKSERKPPEQRQQEVAEGWEALEAKIRRYLYGERGETV